MCRPASRPVRRQAWKTSRSGKASQAANKYEACWSPFLAESRSLVLPQSSADATARQRAGASPDRFPAKSELVSIFSMGVGTRYAIHALVCRMGAIEQSLLRRTQQ